MGLEMRMVIGMNNFGMTWPMGCASRVPTMATASTGAPDWRASRATAPHPTDAMIILPCSMGTLAAIASGLAANLIQRAADVCLKENRPLILCVRETPFNRIHLRNMQLASDAGATIFPVIPTLYNHPQSTQDMARNFVHRVLAHIGLPQPNAYQWQPD